MSIGTKYWWLLFYYDHVSSDCTSGCIVTSNYWSMISAMLFFMEFFEILAMVLA
jgi:hypothetical protein